MIKSEDIGVKTSVWQIVADILQKYGELPVFPPATHKGQCTKPYIVLKEDGATNVAGYSSMYQYFRIMLYVPKNKYSQLDYYDKQLVKIIEEHIYPLLLPTGQKESDYYDDNYDAHMRTFLYRNVYRQKGV